MNSAARARLRAPASAPVPARVGARARIAAWAWACTLPAWPVAAQPAPAAVPAAAASTAPADDAARHLQFVEEFAATCVARQGVQILVRNTHPTRTVRVWLDRYHMGVGTGDRSRTDLKPGAEPDPLGCSRSLTGVQEWRVARAVYVD